MKKLCILFCLFVLLGLVGCSAQVPGSALEEVKSSSVSVEEGSISLTVVGIGQLDSLLSNSQEKVTNDYFLHFSSLAGENIGQVITLRLDGIDKVEGNFQHALPIGYYEVTFSHPKAVSITSSQKRQPDYAGGFNIEIKKGEVKKLPDLRLTSSLSPAN